MNFLVRYDGNTIVFSVIHELEFASSLAADYTNNRVANMNPDGSGVVSIMDDLKEYEVNSTKYCQRYCPIPKRQAQLVPFHLPNGSVDIGSTKVSQGSVSQYSRTLYRNDAPITV